jgi:hypothetical protein
MLFEKRNRQVWGLLSGRISGFLLLATLSGFMLSQPASAANVTVASPVNGTTVSSPVWVRAHNVGCNGLTPTAFGYSIDSSSTLVKGVTVYDIDTQVAISAGTHTIHYKAWTSSGVCPVVSTTFKVAGGSSSTTSGSTSSSSTTPSSGSAVYSLPSYAVPSANLDSIGGWSAEHDAGTPGSSKGSMVYPASTPSYDDAREFYMTYTNHGGERWHVTFGNNPSSANFVLDTYVYIVNPSQVANIEIDLNQVMSNGETVIYGTQCSKYSGTWEYSYTSGGSPHWKSSGIGCNPLTWAAKTWHHIQVGYHRNSSGVVTHDWVNFDGAHHVFSGATNASALWLGWAKGSLLVNFQIDGENSSGSVTSYIHKMTFYHW